MKTFIMNRLNHQDRLSIFGCEGALRSTNLLSETGGLLLLHPHMHSQTLNKTNSTNSSRYPQYSTLYHFSTFLQHHVITKTQEKKKLMSPAPLIAIQKSLSRFNIASSLQISERLDQSIIVPFPMEQPPKHLTPHLYSEKRQFLHEFELPSNLTETAPRSPISNPIQLQ